MLTLGVDLASQDRNTAVCVVRWVDAGASVERLEAAADNAAITTLMREADVAGLDAPFGWPARFIDAVTAWTHTGRWPEVWAVDVVRRLRLRETDLWIHAQTGKWPLSVSTDSIAVCAMRAAVLLSLASENGGALDRVRGPWFEAYPGATLVEWGLAGASARYKTDRDVRDRLVRTIARSVGLTLSAEHRAACAASDHLLDAFICALVARAAATARTHARPEELDEELVRREGWIQLPVAGSLERLRFDRGFA